MRDYFDTTAYPPNAKYLSFFYLLGDPLMQPQSPTPVQERLLFFFYFLYKDFNHTLSVFAQI